MVLVKVTLEEVNKGLKDGQYVRDGYLYSSTGMILEKVQEDREKRGAETGIVVQVGPEAYDNKPAPWCKVGDQVFFTRYTGKEVDGSLVGEAGVSYMIINDDDVKCVIEQ